MATEYHSITIHSTDPPRVTLTLQPEEGATQSREVEGTEAAYLIRLARRYPKLVRTERAA